MRLLNTSTFGFEQYYASQTPQYAILSHTWSEEEVTYEEMLAPGLETKHKVGFAKITDCCRLAAAHGLTYAWIDTCCIDKRSSAELSEAINSMYRWYRDAAICFIYMADVDSLESTRADDAAAGMQHFEQSRWFERGWTLQELLASRQRLFFSKDWKQISLSSEVSGDLALYTRVAEITGIDLDVLQHKKSLSSICVAERIAWASRRVTTREEDEAYCLMGILNVNMPILYGEGAAKSFRRLQEEYMKTSYDYSLFAWTSQYKESGLLARSPADFVDSPKLGMWEPSFVCPFQMTNVGLMVTLNFNSDKDFELEDRLSADTGYTRAALQVDVKTKHGWGIFVVRLRPVKATQCFVNGEDCRAYRRVGCPTLEAADSDTFTDTAYQNVLVLEDEHLELVDTAHQHDLERRMDGDQSFLDKPLYSDL